MSRFNIIVLFILLSLGVVVSGCSQVKEPVKTNEVIVGKNVVDVSYDDWTLAEIPKGDQFGLITSEQVFIDEIWDNLVYRGEEDPALVDKVGVVEVDWNSEYIVWYFSPHRDLIQVVGVELDGVTVQLKVEFNNLLESIEYSTTPEIQQLYLWKVPSSDGLKVRLEEIWVD